MLFEHAVHAGEFTDAAALRNLADNLARLPLGYYFFVPRSLDTGGSSTHLDSALFRDISEGALPGPTLAGWSAFGDFNGDAFPDLLLQETVRAGLPTLLINDGAGRFSDASQTHLPPLPVLSLNATFGDLNDDTFPDLVVTGFNGVNEPFQSALFVLINDGTGKFNDRLAAGQSRLWRL